MKRIFANTAIALTINIFLSIPVFCQSNDYIKTAPEVTPEMLSANYWLAKSTDPYKIRMTQEQIFNWNNQVSKTYTIGSNPYKIVCNLRTFGKTLSAEKIRGEMERYNPKVVYYKKDNEGNAVALADEDYLEFYNNMDYKFLGSFEPDFKIQYKNGKAVPQSTIKKDYKIKKGLCVRRGDIKLFPSDEYLSLDKNYWWDDENHASGILMNEPVLILWESADKNWYLIKTNYTRGWIRKENIALVTDKEFNRYFDFASSNHEAFITITENRYSIPRISYLDYVQDEIPDLFLGTYLHIKRWTDKNLAAVNIDERMTHGCYAAEIPYKKENGTLGFRYAEIPFPVCTKGLVPFTQSNTLNLLFKCIGNPYGWGGQNEYRDCSALAMEVYRCFGFTFARNSLAQASMPGKTIDFNGTTDEETTELCKDLPAGTVMYFSGHIFMFVGMENGKPYFISASGSYLNDAKDKKSVVHANSVIVNNGDLLRLSGNSWLNIITYAKLIEYDTKNPVIKLNPEWDYASFSKIHSDGAVLYKATKDPKNITIAINAGHGTTDGEKIKTYCHPDKSKKYLSATEQLETPAVSKGSTSISGLTEAEINFRTANLLRLRLLNNGYNVLMIRDGRDVQLDNIGRTVISNNNADIHISIHYDYQDNSTANSVFFCGIPEELKSLQNVEAHFADSQRLGECLVKALEEKGMTLSNNGEIKTDLAQTSFSTIPTCVIELGNQNTKIGYDSLNDRVNGLLNGINTYFGF